MNHDFCVENSLFLISRGDHPLTNKLQDSGSIECSNTRGPSNPSWGLYFFSSTQERRESTEKGTKTKKTKKAKEKKEPQKPQVTQEEKPQKWRRITVKDVQYDDEVVSFFHVIYTFSA